MRDKRFLFRTGSLAIPGAILAVIVAATTVVAGTGFLTKDSYRQNEGIFEAFKDGPVNLPDTAQTIARLRLPNGDYMIVAKLWADPNSSGGMNDNMFARCLLLAGPAGGPDTDSDISVINLAKTTVPTGHTAAGTLALTLAHRIRPGDPAVKLRCDDNGANAQAHDIKIIAIRARNVTFRQSP